MDIPTKCVLPKLADIVKAVYSEAKDGRPKWNLGIKGPSGDVYEDAVEEIVRRVKEEISGLANQEYLEWAAKQYFRLLLIDLRRFKGMFQDHGSCEPKEIDPS